MFWKYSFLVPLVELMVYETFKGRFSQYYGGQPSASILEKVALASPFSFMAFLNSVEKFGITAPVFIPSPTDPVYVPPSPTIGISPHPGPHPMRSSTLFVAYTGTSTSISLHLLLASFLVMFTSLTVINPRCGNALLSLGSRSLHIMALFNNCYDFVVEELQATLWDGTYQVGHLVLTRLKQAKKQFGCLLRDILRTAVFIANSSHVFKVLISAFYFVENLGGPVVGSFHEVSSLLVLSWEYLGQVFHLPRVDSIIRGVRQGLNYLTSIWKSALVGLVVIFDGVKANTLLDAQDLDKAFDLNTSLDSSTKCVADRIAFGNHSGKEESVKHIVKKFSVGEVSEHQEGAVQDNATRNTIALSPRLSRSTKKQMDVINDNRLSEIKGLPLVVVPELALPFDLCHDDTIDLTEYHVLDILGRGAYGSVVKAIHSTTGRVIAVKRIPDHDCWGDISVGILEFNSMKRLKNLENGGQWFPSLYAFAMEGEEFVMAMTFYPRGTLAQLMDVDGGIDRVRSTFYTAELIIAIHIIHQEGIIHQDIKPSNILIDHDGHLVLADFGCAMSFDLPDDKEGKLLRDLDKKLLGDRFPRLWATWDNPDVVTQRARVGTDMFAAPEVFRYQDYSYGVDYFAMGVMFFCMLTGRGPYDAADTVMDVVDLKASNLDYQKLTNEEIHFLLGVLRPNQFERFDLTQMKSHKIFSEINWKALENRQVPVPPVVQL